MSDDSLLTSARALATDASGESSLRRQLATLAALPPAERRAACQQRDGAGRTALHYVSEAGAAWAAEELLRSAGFNHTEASAASAAAAAAAAAPSVAFALASAQDGQGQTALHLALKAAGEQRKSSTTTAAAASSSASRQVSDGHCRIAHLLLDVEEAGQKRPAAPEQPASDSADTQAAKRPRLDGDSASVMSAAVATDAASAAASSPVAPSLLLLPDSFMRLPLHWAVTCGSDDVLIRCLTLGATVSSGSSSSSALLSSQTRSGDTPLHWACADGRLAAVDALLSAGADPAVRNGRGETPLDLCTSDLCRSAIQAWLDKNAASISSVSSTAGGASASSVDAAAGVCLSSAALSAPRAGVTRPVTTAPPKKKIAIKLKK